MKRIVLNKNVRIGVAIALILATIVCLLILYQAYRLPDTVNREIVVSKYYQSSHFDYTVNLIPNKLYNVNTIVGENQNQTYFAKIIRDISTEFTYGFDATGKGTDIQGSYDITAVLSTDMWEKKFVLVPKKEFKGMDETDFTEKIAVDINYYNNILANITKEIDVQPKDYKLMLVYNINAVITKDGGQVGESFVPIITITSTKGAFNIRGDISKTNESAIKRTESDMQLGVLEDRFKFMVITIILVIVLGIFLVTTKNIKEKVSETEKKAQDIKKKYGDMIIYSNGPGLPDIHIHHKVITGSIEDIVKAAEQLDEPIISSGLLYYVYDGSTIYMYTIQES